MAHANISIFVPHMGCPNMCSFCNQRFIAGTEKIPDENTVIDAVSTAMLSPNYNPESTEIAFFGGSFTAIDKDYMVRLLSAAYQFVEQKKVSGIRISTRPDVIDADILSTLKKYGVTAIELGAQSMDDDVLKLNDRGHTVECVEKASLLIKQYGFSLGLQMMTGLYGDTDEKALKTAQKIIALKPDTVRIYPTIVLQNTRLESLYNEGVYKPQTIDEAVCLASELLLMFKKNNINVIRTGLHSIDTTKFVAGPWHPAFKELCDANIYLKKALSTLKAKGEYIIYVPVGAISKMTGQKRKNIEILKDKGFNCVVKEDSNLKEYEIYLQGM